MYKSCKWIFTCDKYATTLSFNKNVNNQETIEFNNSDSDTNAKSNWNWSKFENTCNETDTESQSDDNTSIASIMYYLYHIVSLRIQLIKV